MTKKKTIPEEDIPIGTALKLYNSKLVCKHCGTEEGTIDGECLGCIHRQSYNKNEI